MENKDNQPIEGLNKDNDDKKSSDSVMVKNTYQQYYFGYGTEGFDVDGDKKVDVIIEHTDDKKVDVAESKDGEKVVCDGNLNGEKDLSSAKKCATETGESKAKTEDLEMHENSNYFTSGTGRRETPVSDFSSGAKFDKEFLSGGNKDFSYLVENKTDASAKNKGLGIASMVLGILSVVCCCMDGLAIILAILAIIFAAIRIKTKADGFAIAGLVTGIIGALFNLIMFILLVSGVASEIYNESLYEVIRLLLK